MRIFGRPHNLKMDSIMDSQEALGRHRILGLYGPIGNFVSRQDYYGVTNISDTLVALNYVSDSPIKLVIESPGGEVDSALELYDMMKLSRAPVWTICRSALSAAVILFAGGTPGHRYIYEHSRIMLHLPSGYGVGDSNNIKIYSQEISRIKDVIVDVLIECGAKKSHSEILQDIDRDFWMTAQDAIDYGLADHIITKENNPLDVKKSVR